MLFSLAANRSCGGGPSTLHVVSETTLCLRLARTTVGPWSFQYLTTTKAATLGDLSCLQIGDVIDITAQREANKMRTRQHCYDDVAACASAMVANSANSRRPHSSCQSPAQD